MKIAVFSTKSYDRQFLEAANVEHKHELVFFEPRLTALKSIAETIAGVRSQESGVRRKDHSTQGFGHIKNGLTALAVAIP